MTGSWGSVLTELIPLGLVITLSPLSIIPAVLVLHSPRARPAGLLYLLGWVLTLAVITGAFVQASDLVAEFDEPPRWASWLRVAIGAALIAFGIFRWLTRHRSAHSPAWMRQLTTATPAKAGVTAVALAVVNPKVLFLCIAAGLAIGTAGIGSPEVWVAVAYFVAVAAASVALPVLAYAIFADRLERPLARLKDWMEKHNAALMAAILVVIGLLVLVKGIHGL